MFKTPSALGARCKLLGDGALRWLVHQERQHDHVALRLRFLAWIGCFGMPLYYLIWTVWFPQEYESLGLRGFGMTLCVLALFMPHVAGGLWLRAYEFVGVTYVLPFFFSYMFLMNHASAVWAQSLLAALVVLFHFDWWWAVGSCLCGFVAAGCAFALTGDASFLSSPQVLEQLPIYLFTVVVVSITKVGRRVLAREKLSGMAQALAMVSHELRTPLLSVAANVRGIERAFGAARRAPAAPADIDVDIAAAMQRIQFEVGHMNKMIDLFLHSAAAMKEQLAATEQVSMASVVASVIERYPFAAREQRDLVSVVVRRDFTFEGKYELCVVVLLNLLRNALKALQRAGKGRVRIVVDGARARPQLLVIDSGCGIPPDQLPRIFERFHSYPPSTGSGIGLSLCKDIIQGWHGRIRCRSRESSYTVFTLEFPDAARPEPALHRAPRLHPARA